VVPQVGGCWGC